MSNSDTATDKNYFDRIFLGTKEQFWKFIHGYNINRTSLHSDLYQWIPDKDIFGLDNDCLLFWDIKNNCRKLPIIKAEELPQERTLLRIYFGSSNLADPKHYWGLLESELIRVGWMDTPTPDKKASQSKKESSPIMRASTLKKYRGIYTIYQQMLEEYLGFHLDDENENPKVSMKEFRDRVMAETNYRDSERNLRRIIKKGDNGELN